MASSKGHVDERRLRPVYDALDNLNNKQAIKLSEAILKKQKDCHCAKALKALALIRSGKKDEAFPLLDDVQQNCSNYDDSTLQAMTMCYKESFQPAGVVAIYETACKQIKNNEEFLSHLFMAYVRVSDFSKQQQAAMNLYKAFPKNPYYFWAVMSNVMQGLSATDPKKKSMFLTLAEKMIVKFVKEGKIEAEEEDQLYLMIMELGEKYEELLMLLDSGELKCLANGGLDEKKVQYLSALKRWPEVNIIYKRLLQKSPDQWSYIKEYLHSYEQLKNYSPDVPVDTKNEQPDFKEETVQKFLEQLSECNPLLRGPRLGLMELSTLQLKDRPETSDNILEQAIQYFKNFGSKPCCFGDLSLYAKYFDSAQKEKFMSSIKESLQQCSDERLSDKEKLKNLREEICFECFSRRLNTSNEDLLEKAKRYTRRYFESLELGKTLNKTEPQHGDVLILLAFYTLLDLNKEKGDDSTIWYILTILEQAVEKSPGFCEFKLLLMFLYYRLGVSGICDKMVEQIDIKYIMYDSLGYFLCNGLYGSGQFQLTQRMYNASHAFYKASRKDIPEQIIASYKFGSFRQVIDIMSFRKRVENSGNRAWVRVEQLYLDLMKFCSSVTEARKCMETMTAELESINLSESAIKSLQDNRDLSLFSSYEEYSREFTKEEKRLSFEQHVLWIRYRYVSLQLLKECLKCAQSNQNGAKSNGESMDGKENKCTIEELLKEVRDIVKDFKKHNCAKKWETVYLPPPAPLVSIIEWKFDDVFTMLIEASIAIFKSDEIDQDCVDEVESHLKVAQTILEENFKSIQSNRTIKYANVVMFNGKCLGHMVYFVEVCTQIGVVLVAIKDLLKSKGVGRKKRKGQQNSQYSSKGEELQVTVTDFTKSTMKLLNTLSGDLNEKCIGLSESLDESAMEQLFKTDDQAVRSMIWEKVQSSYKQSTLEIIQMVEFKIGFYTALQK